MKSNKKPYRKVIKKILSGEIKTTVQLDVDKRKLTKELNFKRFIRNPEIFKIENGN